MLDKIKAEIQKVLDVEGYSENARVQALALFWVLELIDKYAEQEPCDDAISRQAVLDGIEELKQSPWATDKRGNGFEYLITEALDMVAFLCVKQEPSVRPQEQTGHWKFVCQHWRKCSECGFSHKFAEDWEYCPNCGAKMIEPTCDTCEYNTAAFMPCNACEDKSEYKPQESEVRNEHP